MLDDAEVLHCQVYPSDVGKENGIVLAQIDQRIAANLFCTQHQLGERHPRATAYLDEVAGDVAVVYLEVGNHVRSGFHVKDKRVVIVTAREKICIFPADKGVSGGAAHEGIVAEPALEGDGGVACRQDVIVLGRDDRSIEASTSPAASPALLPESARSTKTASQ